ncbi:MAG: hypothetical protein A2509_10635 [Candidatus Edwardsbacteria bacterium RIFOXYD12_FULL_50_11]|uniref:O-antigen ligase-related domain-containing protein n=1 Tax=Candidatus Edwardsbacteria bacterium GWF2_54_11 TaxID=1817851 RepID=A0A1F5RG39_9BACT|nr:MAG: hypothetical protein A2502_09340 [Candidatus Edwardsbacteria bacterium RifOxyC12_full_54_24]OGF07214.1 MAG: hypothetical protein A2273_01715 [Candidatus Edwardsbacteria bacterium RifOxyA12_full_54_48]OGF09469.1 MAG: hypothetical protein A3K15_08125 [Candidatus Edwardsbacteria bacterium GWE2_54_12]OGF13399.1 MAG: hypothetical protein A2024_05290 [Candidatus Edwardsbacteria bacterium GWF2_54_11]OGF17265.1 MAG: hypothetical protein A2509_10635 [Candidatus Edwardsbacteria bacterium RIFOXYD1
MIIDLRNINPNVILKRQPSAAIAYLVLFGVTAWFVWRFGAIALGSLVILSFFTYLAIKKPFYILLVTLATIFFPANFEQALGQTFPITPTRIFGLMLLLAIATHFNRSRWQNLKSNRTTAIAVVLVLWGAFTDLVSYPEYIGTFIIDTIPSLIVLAAVVLFVENREELNKVLAVIMLACLVTAVSGFVIYSKGRMSGLTGNANALAYNCIIGLTLALSFLKKPVLSLKNTLLTGFAGMFLLAFGFAASRSASIGLLVAAFILLRNFIKKPSTLILIFSLFVLFLYIAPEIFWQRFQYIPLPGHAVYSSVQSETGIRAWMYRRGWELFLASPLWGWGAFSFPKVNGSLIPYVMHSWYLGMLCEQGIIGLALYLAFFTTIYKNIKTSIKVNTVTTDSSRYLLALAIGLAVAGIFGSGPLDKLIFIMAGISVVLANISARETIKETDSTIDDTK